MQYKESDYAFLQRMAKRYGEFFYYNGEQLLFGDFVQPIIKLGENIDLIDIEFEMRMGAQEFKYLSYDAQSGSTIEKDSDSITSEFKVSPFQAIAVNTSKKIFRKKPKMHFNEVGIHPFASSELEEAVRREKERRENLMHVKGRSKDPELKIGGRAEISDINNQAMETYRIIDIRHFHESNDYYNEFIGIPDVFNAPYQDNEAVPKGEEQPARVLDNNDPMGMGRVRVQFPWQEAKNQKTPWIRLIQPHSGSGKGFHFIPELGEEVLVDFESQNAEKPFVAGTHYNGSETSSYHTAGNDKKVIHTRSGTKIILNDAEGSVFIEDPSGNTYLMDGAGNIKVKAPKDISFEAGKNMYLNIGENLYTNVGINKIDFVGMNYAKTVGMNYVSTIAGNASTKITGKSLTQGEGEIKIEAKQMDIAGFDNLLMHSDKEAKVNSKGSVNVQGLDGTNQNNKPDNYVKTIIEKPAICIANVRPLAAWKGEFGCDFYQSGNAALGEDLDYSKIVGRYYNINDDKMLKLKEKETTKTSFAEYYTKSNQNLWFSFSEGSDGYKLVHNFHLDPQYKENDNILDGLQELYAAFKYKKKIVDKEYVNCYATYISLFPNDWKTNVPKKANLQIFFEFFDIINKPDDVVFKHNGKLLDADSPVKINRPIIATPLDNELITIETVEQSKYSAIVADDIIIEIIARKKNGENYIETNAGEIRLMNPNKAKTLKMVEVSVKTLTKKGREMPESKRQSCKKILNQCLIDTDFISIDTPTALPFTIDLSAKEYKFKKTFKAKSEKINGAIIWTITKDGNLKDVLDAEFTKKYSAYKKDEFFPIYLMDVKELENSSSISGYTYLNQNFCVLFASANDSTLPHECLHGLDLRHSFNSKSTYTYKAMATHNVMDYNMLEDPTDKIKQINNGVEIADIKNSHVRLQQYQLWAWQWKKANKSKFLTP